MCVGLVQCARRHVIAEYVVPGATGQLLLAFTELKNIGDLSEAFDIVIAAPQPPKHRGIRITLTKHHTRQTANRGAGSIYLIILVDEHRLGGVDVGILTLGFVPSMLPMPDRAQPHLKPTIDYRLYGASERPPEPGLGLIGQVLRIPIFHPGQGEPLTYFFLRFLALKCQPARVQPLENTQLDIVINFIHLTNRRIELRAKHQYGGGGNTQRAGHAESSQRCNPQGHTDAGAHDTEAGVDVMIKRFLASAVRRFMQRVLGIVIVKRQRQHQSEQAGAPSQGLAKRTGAETC
ncbi:hypothetical protein PFLmoz3_02492 [Pseudomonas fluorescens]|uniref:Uncharacterized protein n=1 Tax=Pseudomonas fluorescens TaxID=294 RepID=A0A109LHQ9_PSEFL|nr:hypothetical protein PFLmoz3_02492 [Pseudomonas fluorescens]